MHIYMIFIIANTYRVHVGHQYVLNSLRPSDAYMRQETYHD